MCTYVIHYGQRDDFVSNEIRFSSCNCKNKLKRLKHIHLKYDFNVDYEKKIHLGFNYIFLTIYKLFLRLGTLILQHVFIIPLEM